MTSSTPLYTISGVKVYGPAEDIKPALSDAQPSSIIYINGLSKQWNAELLHELFGLVFILVCLLRERLFCFG